jgi:NitT/TauT family transport system substrate-binding protein
MRNHRRLVLASVSVLLLGVAACSSAGSGGSASTTTGGGGASASGSASGSASAAAAVTALKVGTSPTLSNASLYLAIDNGIFKGHGLDVSTQLETSGAEAIPQLLNGQIKFTAADPLGSLVAISQHVPVVIVAQANVVSATGAQDPTGLVVSAGSGIRSAAGLAGKTVAVNALDSLSQVTAEAAIDALGGNSASVKFVELPIPQMIAAVQRGTVSGAVLAEPYVTAAKEAGLVDLFPVMSKVIPGTPQVVYIASKAYAAANPGVVKAFVASLDAADTDLSDDPALIRSVGLKSTTVGASVLAKIVLPTFTSSPLGATSLAALEQLMVKYKVLKAPLQPSQYLYSAG